MAKQKVCKKEIIDWIRKYFENQPNAKGAVIGISGGKDSTVVAKLLVEALGKDRVLGVLMPNGLQKDIEDSYAVCELLGIKYKEVNIYDAFEGIIGQLTDREGNCDLTEQALVNLAPRLRMATLYAIGTSMGYRIVGTSNFSEKLVGYYTKFGDNAHDFNPIAHLTCGDVIELGYQLGLPPQLIEKTPSDGLTGKSDEDNLGITYEQIDRFANEGTSGSKEVDDIIFTKWGNNLHKVLPPAVVTQRIFTSN